MKTQYTRWSPDTCGCEIIFTWDSDLPVEQRVHRGHSIERKCQAHKDIPDVKTHHDIILEENQRKNITHGKLGMDKKITWEFTGQSPNRMLHIFHEGKKLAEVGKK